MGSRQSLTARACSMPSTYAYQRGKRLDGNKLEFASESAFLQFEQQLVDISDATRGPVNAAKDQAFQLGKGLQSAGSQFFEQVVTHPQTWNSELKVLPWHVSNAEMQVPPKEAFLRFMA